MKKEEIGKFLYTFGKGEIEYENTINRSNRIK